jgi:hypothetical protein
MKTIWHHLNNDKGSVIVAALMILALLTIIGFAATNMSSTELSISTNSLLYERAFYVSEAGLQHAKESLRKKFKEYVESGGSEQWDFALTGAVDSSDPTDGIGDYGGGVLEISDGVLNNVNYTVTIWNNDDGGSPTDDIDGLIWVRADAAGPVRGGRCSIEELVLGTSDGEDTAGYTAQEGAGSGKVYTSRDKNEIDFAAPDFTATSF